VHYRDELVARGWAAQENLHLPLTWHALAALGIVIGAFLIWFVSPRGNEILESPLDEGKAAA
jgi:hypothetical protein